MTPFKKELPLFQSVATLIGTIIGAGILGVPYVFSQAGFWTGTLVLVFITFAMISLKLIFGEMSLRTYGKHQISGYVEKYLGKFWRDVTSVVLILTISGSLLAYFVGVGQVLAEVFGGVDVLWGLLFYVLASLFLFCGIKLIKSIEFILTIVIFLIVLVITFLSLNHLNAENWSGFNTLMLFAPYGVILFACSGIVAVPEVREILFRKEHLFKKAIYWGAAIPSIIYFIFALVVVGVSGPATTEVATIGLGHFVGKKVLVIGNLFAFFTMATSFLTIGLALKEALNYDFKIKHVYAWLITVSSPLVIYFLGLNDFIKIISIAGALGFGVNGVVYIFAYWRARKRGERQPEYILPKSFAMPVSVFLVLVFIGGLIYTLWESF